MRPERPSASCGWGAAQTEGIQERKQMSEQQTPPPDKETAKPASSTRTVVVTAVLFLFFFILVFSLGESKDIPFFIIVIVLCTLVVYKMANRKK
jgi:hypothetical protein